MAGLVEQVCAKLRTFEYRTVYQNWIQCHRQNSRKNLKIDVFLFLPTKILAMSCSNNANNIMHVSKKIMKNNINSVFSNSP